MTAIREGLYRADFSTLTGSGWGLVALVGGKAYGGDPMIYYTGTYTVVGDEIEARVKGAAHQHTPGYESLFGRENNTIVLTGKIEDDEIVLEGRSKQASGIPIQIRLTYLGS